MPNPKEPSAEAVLTFADLRAANLARVPPFRDRKGRLCHGHNEAGMVGFDWMLSQWSNATLGELGEAANIIKKIERGDTTLDEARTALAREFADVQTYLDLLAHRAGVDLGAATIAKWNEVSERLGIDLRLEPQAVVTARELDERCASAVARAVKEEREACARTVETQYRTDTGYGDLDSRATASECRRRCAAAIRARAQDTT